MSNKILSSSGPNHIFEILLPSLSNEIDQSDNFFGKANEPLVKLQRRRNESIKGIQNFNVVMCVL